MGVAVPPGVGWRRGFTALRNRHYALYFVGNIGFFTAMSMTQVAQGWLAYDLTGSAKALSWIGASSAISIIALSPLGGVVADRIEKRRLLIIGQGFVFLATLFLALLIASGMIRYWHMLASALFMGVVWSFIMPARMAYVVELVGRDTLMNAMALNNGAMNLTRIVGPALAGVLLGVIGAHGIYFIAAACYIIGISTLFLLPSAEILPGQRGRTVGGDIAENARYILAHQSIWLLLLVGTVPMIFAMPYQVLMPIFAEDVWGVGKSGLGILMAVPGIGGLVASLVLAFFGDFRNKGSVLLISAAVFCLLLIPFALSPTFLSALPFLALAGMGAMSYQVINMTLLQTQVADEVRGRVMSVFMMSFGLMPLGAVPAGFIADAWGTPLAVATLAAVPPVFVLFIGLRYPQFRKLA